MPRYLAFLRAINVGGRTVKMDRLRALFEAAGLAAVETFIASGNVAFETDDTNPRALETRIEATLRDGLGFEVVTFIRSAAELSRVAAADPFPGEDGTLHIAFLADPPTADAALRLLDRRTPTDAFHFDGRELYWLVRGRVSDSPFSGPLLEKNLGCPTTVRNANTVRKLAAKYPG